MIIFKNGFYKHFLEDIKSFLWGHLPLIPLFRTSNDICPGFQNQDGSPCLHASLPVCNEFLKFTIAATPADLLVVSMAAELCFWSTYLHPHKHWWGLIPGSRVPLPYSVWKDRKNYILNLSDLTNLAYLLIVKKQNCTYRTTTPFPIKPDSSTSTKKTMTIFSVTSVKFW